MKLQNRYTILFLLMLSFAGMSQEIILDHVNVIDVKNLSVVEDQSIWIKDSKIKGIYPAKSSKKHFPKQVLRLDMTGKFLSPGLIDSHVHHATDPDGYDNYALTRDYYQHHLRHGITAVRDMGGDARALLKYKRDAMIDVIQSPDIYFSAIIAGPEFFKDPRTVASSQGHQSGTVPWIRSITEESDWQKIILNAQGIGATGIKIYRELPAELLGPIVSEAKKHKMQVWSHSYIDPATPEDAFSAGVEVISHADGLVGISKQAVTEWFESGGRDYKLLIDQEAVDDRLSAMHERNIILDATLVIFEQLGQHSELTQIRYQLAKAMTQAAHKKGIPIAAGTDFPVRDFTTKPMLYRELELMVNEVGMTPIEALQTATLNGAKVLGIEKTHGEIAVGKTANLLVFDHDPTSDIKHLSSLAHVIKNGSFIYRGIDDTLPFSAARTSGNQLWISGQLGNIPGTKTLIAADTETQMHQTMKNIGHVLTEYRLGYHDLFKCTLMLADIKDWAKASEVYKQYFKQQLPARSAFATDGLALGAKIEVECIANL